MNPHTPIAKPRGVRQNLFSFAIQTQLPSNQLPRKTLPEQKEEPPRTPEPSKRNKKEKKWAEDRKAEAD